MTMNDGRIPSEPAIRFEQVNKWFGTHHVLRDVTLDVLEGETLVVCGPSGSGKSTLTRTINAPEGFDSGRLTVAGRQLGDRTAKRAVHQRVGMVFQSFNLFTHLNVIDNLTLAPEMRRELNRARAEDEALALLDRIGLSDQARKFPGHLSGGQQQRVAIARTLMMRPEILLFDEPTSALDPEIVAEIPGLMETLSGQGRTIVCVTHEMGFARRAADRVIFMADGSLVEQGLPDAFFSRPRSLLARNFLERLLH